MPFSTIFFLFQTRHRDLDLEPNPWGPHCPMAYPHAALLPRGARVSSNLPSQSRRDRGSQALRLKRARRDGGRAGRSHQRRHIRGRQSHVREEEQEKGLTSRRHKAIKIPKIKMMCSNNLYMFKVVPYD